MATSILVTAQHYLECATPNCEKNCQFYCNPCHQRLCEQCREEHQRSPETKNHEVVPFLEYIRQPPVEKCKLHPPRNADILCDECNIPLCSKCTTMQEHCGHKFVDLQVIRDAKIAFCNEKISQIQEYFLPISQDLKKDADKDYTEIKTLMDSIRNSIKAEAESLKELVDKVTADTLEQTNIIEKSLLRVLKQQKKTYQDYIEYLKELSKEYQSYLPFSNFKVLLSARFKTTKIRPIPETTKPVLPVYTAGQFSYEDVSKLLGNVKVPNNKPGERKINPIATSSTQLKQTRKEMTQNKERSDLKQPLALYFSITKVREYKVPGVGNLHHISLGKSGRLWVSDDRGNLVETDPEGNQLKKIQTSGGREGYHTVTQGGDLIYTDQDNNLITRIRLGYTITESIKRGDWRPLSIHYSHTNGDILVGMIKGGEAKVTRYNNNGEEIQNIQKDNQGHELYEYPHYITENINGDICTSDLDKRAVLVAEKSGQHRFSYTGQGSVFYPYGICTDLLGHIIVCDNYFENKTVDILDQDGRFLSVLLAPQHGLEYPRSVCVDAEKNIHVGQDNTNTVTVYKYLQ